MIPFSIPKAKDQPDLLQKIHSSAELQRLLLIASEENKADSSKYAPSFTEI
jgi:hypothetical protein